MCVVTQPDKPQGRSRSTLVPSPVKVEAVQQGLTIVQPEKPVGDEFYGAIRALEPDIGVVVAYGHILKPELLEIPARGMINIHPSLLPLLRGAAPIPWTIKEGHQSTGVTIIQMSSEMDAGAILHQLTTPVPPDETTGELNVRLAELGALALIECLSLMDAGVVNLRAQDHARATFTKKIDRDTCRITWNEDAMSVARTIHAFDPKPGAWSELDGKTVKLYGASHRPDGGEPGEVVAVDPELVVATGLGAVKIHEVQPEGRPRMSADDWVRGRGVSVGQRFT